MKQLIEGWFLRLSKKVMNYYSYRPLDKVNNHDYWAAWAVMLTAVVLQDHQRFNGLLSIIKSLYRKLISKVIYPMKCVDRHGHLLTRITQYNLCYG